MERLRDRVAIVTGSASGIGHAIALGYAAEGAIVVAVTDRNVTGLESLVAEIRDRGGRAEAFQADVSDPDAVDRVVARTVAQLGKVDVLVSCAGLQSNQSFLDATVEDWDRVIAVNLRGVFLIGQRVAREMVRQGSGVIINIASQAAARYVRGLAPQYHASKGGLIQLTKVMAGQLGPHGIRVNGLAPSIVITEKLKERWEANAALREYHLSKSVLGRAATVEDVVGPAIFLASDEARFITGQTLYVDGGFTIL